jgi:triacylglycerol esterase/lipase EstA (alpha/beta hydrolase family)
MEHQSNTIVLLHGILRTDNCMRKLEIYFERNGYKTLNIHYPSRTQAIEDLAEDFLSAKLKDLSIEGKIHFVTHSMGGLLLHAYLAKHKIPNLGRVVMLSPPHNGSEIVDFFKRHKNLNYIFKKIFGPAGQQLATDDSESFVNQKKYNVHYDLGIIAGSKVINPAGYALIKKASDGTVSVDSTKIKGMRDHITLPVDHLFMVKDKNVISQALYFIEHGAFCKD